MKRREILNHREQLREILNCVPARCWLQEQACQKLDRNRSAKTRLFIVEIMQYSGDIWRGGNPPPDPDDYGEALSRTWEWFNARLCSCDSEKAYNPQLSSFTTWFNMKLRYKLIEVIKEKPDHEGSAPLEKLASSSFDNLTLIEELLSLVQRDAGGKLRKSHMQNYPHITCQKLMILILQSLDSLPQIPWDHLAQKFEVDKDSLKKFHQGTCRPHFKQFLNDAQWF
ncbi:MAG: hypothetical protein HC769_04560 [Cyanobacteria bacterium CRU_2_1]|nr:hypothetical protein [Cyanobacteria bacterium CRU_2_1]